MMKARAAILETVGEPLVLADIVIEEPGENEILIEVRASGLCHSDLSYIDHDYGFRLPIVLGHEVAGVVVAVGPGVQELTVGDHVVTCLAGHCGFCSFCAQGKSWLCSEQHRALGRPRGSAPRLTRDGAKLTQSAHIGGLADHILVSQLAAVRIPKELPMDLAAVLGCSVVTGVGAATKVANIRPGDTVAVVGCGAVGLNILQGARVAGAGSIMAIDLDDTKLALASRFGADCLCNASAADPVAAVRTRFGGGAEHVFEVVGTAAATAQAAEMTGRGGHTYLVGQPKPQARYVFDGGDLVTSAKTIHGVLMGGTQFRLDIPRYADMYLRGQLNLEELIGARVGLDDVNAGFEAMRSRTASGRTIVVF